MDIGDHDGVKSQVQLSEGEDLKMKESAVVELQVVEAEAEGLGC